MKYVSKIHLIIILPLFIFSCSARKSVMGTSTKTYKAPADFRVVGYLLGGEIDRGHANHFNVARLNYLNVFFNGVDSSGKFRRFKNLDSLIAAAHKNNVKVIGS